MEEIYKTLEWSEETKINTALSICFEYLLFCSNLTCLIPSMTPTTKKSCCASIGLGVGKSDLMVMESADDALTRKEKDGV